MKTIYWVLGIIVIVVLVGGYLGRHQIKALLGMNPTPAPVQQSASVPEAPVPSSTEASTSGSEAVGMITVQGTDYAFTPSTLTGKAGQPMTVTFKNMGKFPHNFAIAELNVKTKTIQPGQEDTITFTPSKAGSFEYTCTIDSHAEKGMTGTLTVN